MKLPGSQLRFSWAWKFITPMISRSCRPGIDPHTKVFSGTWPRASASSTRASELKIGTITSPCFAVIREEGELDSVLDGDRAPGQLGVVRHERVQLLGVGEPAQQLGHGGGAAQISGERAVEIVPVGGSGHKAIMQEAGAAGNEDDRTRRPRQSTTNQPIAAKAQGLLKHLALSVGFGPIASDENLPLPFFALRGFPLASARPGRERYHRAIVRSSPDTNTITWATTGALNMSRRYHTSTSLADGRALAAGAAARDAGEQLILATTCSAEQRIAQHRPHILLEPLAAARLILLFADAAALIEQGARRILERGPVEAIECRHEPCCKSPGDKVSLDQVGGDVDLAPSTRIGNRFGARIDRPQTGVGQFEEALSSLRRIGSG